MLNDILRMPEFQSIFETMGKEKAQTFVLNLIKIANSYGCNPGEILNELGEQLSICYYCGQAADIHQKAVCQNCYETVFTLE